MDAISLLVAEFTEELIWAQVGIFSFFATYYLFVYVIAKREKVKPEWVPGAVVKEYLNEIRDREAVMRQQLFGETSGQVIVAQSGGGDNTALVQELSAVRAQLGSADQRIAEKDKIIEELKANQGAGSGDGAEALAAAKKEWEKEKSILEEKLAAAGSGSSDGASPEVQKELEEMRARLDEYEVIEDDLANLKKYQIENKKLREKLAAEGINADDIEGPSAASAGAKVESVPEAESAADDSEDDDNDADSGDAGVAASEAEETTESVEAAAEPEAETAEAETADEVAAEVEAAADATVAEPESESEASAEEEAVAESADSKKKSDDKKAGTSEEDLLSEFEKMLAS